MARGDGEATGESEGLSRIRDQTAEEVDDAGLRPLPPRAGVDEPRGLRGQGDTDTTVDVDDGVAQGAGEGDGAPVDIDDGSVEVPSPGESTELDGHDLPSHQVGSLTQIAGDDLPSHQVGSPRIEAPGNDVPATDDDSGDMSFGAGAARKGLRPVDEHDDGFGRGQPAPAEPDGSAGQLSRADVDDLGVPRMEPAELEPIEVHGSDDDGWQPEATEGEDPATDTGADHEPLERIEEPLDDSLGLLE